MRGQDCVGAGRDGALDLFRIDVAGVALRVHEDWTGPVWRNALAVAQKIIGVVITSAPGPTPDTTGER